MFDKVHQSSIAQQKEYEANRTDEDNEKDDSGGRGEDSESEAPLLFVDVNLGPNDQRRIVVYDGDDAKTLARQFCIENDLDEDTQEKLEQLLNQQIASVLQKIEEDED